jgi:transposase
MKSFQNQVLIENKYSVVLGIDWGNQSHDVYQIVPGASKCSRHVVKADPASTHCFIAKLRDQYPDKAIAILSEQGKGFLVNLLLDYDWIDLYTINPHAVSEFRKSLRPSGAKSDSIDSETVARMFFTHHDKLIALSRNDPITRRLDVFTRHRRDLVDKRVALALALKSLLRDYYPQAFEMLSVNVWDSMSLAFLRRWPCFSKLKRAQENTLRTFYYSNGSRSKSLVEKRLQHCNQSQILSNDTVLEETSQLMLVNLLDQIALLNKQIDHLDQQIRNVFNEHPDREFFESLPGAGAAMAPRLAAAFGCNRERFKKCSQMQAYVGVAPITIQSGNSSYTFMRRVCPKFLRQSFHEWAGLSAQYSPWAKACYQMLLDRGKHVGEAKRALAFKWMRILFRCWKNNEIYNEHQYIQSLIDHGSPVIAKMKEMGLIDVQKFSFSS